MTTLRDLRLALGRETDDLELHTVAGAAAGTVTVAALVDAAAGASTLQFAGAYLYAQTSGGNAEGQQVRVRQQGFTPSTGALAFDPAWTAPPVGTLMEITNRYPVIGPSTGTGTTYRRIISRGLSKMVVPRRVNATVLAGQQSVDVSAFGWLDRDERLVGVWEPSPTGGLAVEAGWRRPQLVAGTGHQTLLTVDSPPTTDLLLGLDVLAPADSFIYTTASGVWAESTAGLVLDTDEADVSVEDAMPFMLAEFYAPLVERARGVPTGTFAQAYKDALSACEASRFFDQTARRPQQQQQAAPQPTAAGVA